MYMRHTANRAAVLSCAVSALALCHAATAHAQTAPATPAAVADQSPAAEIIVTGIRASVERAIGVKRNAASVVDAISAEDIGKLPDATISDSLQRVRACRFAATRARAAP